jgi:hypothetical protein
MKRRSFLILPALILSFAAAFFLSDCPHSVGWSGEISLGYPPEEPLTWKEAISHMNSNPLLEGEIVYELGASPEESPPLLPLSHDDPPSANCPREVLIRGNGKTVILTNPGALLTVGPGVDLTLENITLRGVAGNHAPLITVAGGTVRIGPGVFIEGNSNVSSQTGRGGGVRIEAGGVFYMSGGEIRENFAGMAGGGISILGGAAYLSGGSVKDNKSDGAGGVSAAYTGSLLELSGTAVIEDNVGGLCGGVTVGNGAAFNMSGGEIRNNAATYGIGGVYATYSTFNMSGGVVRGNFLANAFVPEGSGVSVVSTTGAVSAFSMSGSALVDPGDPVFLGSGSIRLEGPLTENPAARLVINIPQAGVTRAVLSGDTGAGSPPNYQRFTVDPGSINPDGTWNSLP